MKKAVIDIGSNSVKFLVSELASDGIIKNILDTNEIARLGEGLEKDGLLTEEAIKRNTEAVRGFYEKAVEMGACEVKAVGTMALRKAKNRDEFLKRVKNACGLEISVVPGEEEARLSYLGVLSGFSFEDEAVTAFDTGGGSTEFIFGEGRELKERFSINLGANRIKENYLISDPVSDAEIKRAREDILNELKDAGIKKEHSLLIGIGGTVTTMASVKAKMEVYDADKIQGSVLTKADVEAELAMCKNMTVEERRRIVGLHPKRAEIVVAGALIVDTIMETAGAKELKVSDRGLRHGLMKLLFEQ